MITKQHINISVIVTEQYIKPLYLHRYIMKSLFTHPMTNDNGGNIPPNNKLN